MINLRKRIGRKSSEKDWWWIQDALCAWFCSLVAEYREGKWGLKNSWSSLTCRATFVVAVVDGASETARNQFVMVQLRPSVCIGWKIIHAPRATKSMYLRQHLPAVHAIAPSLSVLRMQCSSFRLNAFAQLFLAYLPYLEQRTYSYSLLQLYLFYKVLSN